MTQILIIEANPASHIAKGEPAFAANFMHVLHAHDPSLHMSKAAPYEAGLTEETLEGVDGVIFTGSTVDWAVDAPEAAPLRAAMSFVFDKGLPTWGSCTGMQAAAVVLGGAVAGSPKGTEWGIAKGLRVLDHAVLHPMLHRRTLEFAAPTMHRDEVIRLPEGAHHLVCNDHSAHQAFAYEEGGIDFWGAQYHPELCPTDIAKALRRAGGEEALADTLDKVASDEEAATALGTTPDAMCLSTRTCEIVNWLSHVNARGAL
jgi:GMP synthase (glutamine-hydrolysing)